jgi:hypothetical protein
LQVLLVSPVLLEGSAGSVPQSGGLERFVPLQICRTQNLGRRHVFSFLVTFFFTLVKKKATRSSARGVEAMAPRKLLDHPQAVK